MSGLSQTIALVRPALDPVLVPPAVLDRVTRLAGLLAPIHRAGFECRLEAEDSQVDFQQCVLAADGEPAALAAAIEQATGPGEPLPPAWRTVLQLCREWSTAGTELAGGLQDIWLEFDLPDAPPRRLTDVSPSVFARLRLEQGNAPLTRARAAAVLAVLGGGLGPDAQRAAFERCAAACPASAWISHLGVMLGRESPGLRLNVSGVPVEEMADYLGRVGWPGDPASIQRLAEELLQFSDGVVLGLDVADTVRPRLGLECFFAPRPDLDPRLKWLLGDLVGRGLCTPEKREALLGWHGLHTPPDTADPWPDDLLIRDLLQPPHRLGILTRRWSHVKLVCEAGRPLRAKGYFLFAPGWLDAHPPAPLDAVANAKTPARTAAAVPDRSRAALVRAMEAAVDFLIQARGQSGLWRDFLSQASPDDPRTRIISGTGDEYVSGYVAAALARCRPAGGALAARALRTAEATWDRLLARHGPRDGWAWNAYSSQDADSTAWVLRLAQALGQGEAARARNARELLLERMGRDGGISAYPPGLFRPLGATDSWAIAHTSITAVAAVLPLGGGPQKFLRGAQRIDGSWTDYWWDDDEFTTARAVEALRAEAEPENGPAVQRAVQWASERLGDGGRVGNSVFATALCLEILAPSAEQSGERRCLGAGLGWMLAQQRKDGSFPPSARMRVPPADAAEVGEFPERVVHTLDDHANFTTATALMACNAVYALDLGGE